MTPIRWLVLQLVMVLAIAAGAVMWASALMGSFDTYHSPFHGRTVAPGDAIGTPLTRRLVFVYVDGLRVDTAANEHLMPYLNELRARGASTVSHSREPSYSVPGYTTMMSGAWPEFNDGPLLNPDEEHLETWPQDNLFRAVKRAGLKIGLADHYSAEKLIPQDTLADHFYVHDERNEDDRAVTEAAIRWLKEGSYQFVVVHLDQVDHMGHVYGPRSPQWTEAARNADILLRELGGALDLSQDTIFITSDHGHIDQGGHGGHEDIVVHEPIIIAGAGVKPGRYEGAEMVDIAPTIAALLGTSIPALSQGRVRTNMLQLTDEQSARIGQAMVKQQQAWLEAYTQATDQTVTIASPNAGDAVTVTQRGVAETRAGFAANERLPRIAIALIPVVLMVLVLWLARGRPLGLELVGALIYIVLFHAAYYLIEGRTYSLSSVLSAADILSVGLGTAAVAFLIAAAFVVWRTGALRHGIVESASTVLGTATAAMAVVGIPALVGYVINGATIGWTMPSFPLQFFTFLSLLQLTGIGITAVLAASIAALAGWRLAKA